MADSPVRLDGWKAIAAHFRRNRSTVIRWAEAGDFPVRRVGGKAGASVWAYAHELDAWLAAGGADFAGVAAERPTDPAPGAGASVQAPTGLAPARPAVSRPRFELSNWRIAAACLVLLVLGGAAVAALSFLSPAAASREQTLPTDPAVADLYLRARDNWATWTPACQRSAIEDFGEVISREPAFAPAYTGLADVYIAAQNYAGMAGEVAFPKAEAAAKAALAIDARSPDANRLLGFLEYWYHNDVAKSREYFQHSIRLNPNVSLTHFWFGSTLCDEQDFDGSLIELNEARRLEPGSKIIEMFYDWALWLRGPGDPGLSDLEDIADHGAPNLVHKLLSQIYFSKGDVRAFLDQNDRLARRLGDSDAAAYVGAERLAFQRGGAAGLLDLIARRPRPAGVAGLSWADMSATVLSLHGRRDELLAVATRANAAGERWITWRPDQSRFARWRGDRAIMDALWRVSGRSRR
jgi:tetratricopeptide (TPR) repeat protein